MEVDFTSKAWLARERDLLERARRGDREAVATLYRAFAPRLFAQVLMPKLGNRQAAEDALSETFRKALEKLDRYDDRGTSFYFWLGRIAANEATDMHRVKARTRRALSSFEELLAPLRPSSPRPEKELAEAEQLAMLKETVQTVLERINPRYARAIGLRFLEDRSREDCAAALDVKLGTFDVVLLRALRAFRKEWEALIGAEAREPA
ncbi:MAG: sigma-70 family RNA polymerase sigma factor [Myxococcota bacterium]|nr:sigma-70 family RNA polymerase sigma factor [Myxococcota bacterium]